MNTGACAASSTATANAVSENLSAARHGAWQSASERFGYLRSAARTDAPTDSSPRFMAAWRPVVLCRCRHNPPNPRHAGA